MSSPAVKICGLCRPEDAAHAAAAGADYVGVILAPGGPRTRSLEAARRIFAAADGPARVGVFVDATLDELLAAAERLRLDVLQLHGSEPPQLGALLRERGHVVWKALRPRSRGELLDGAAEHGGGADALLLDGFSPAAAGGAGVLFDWDAVASARSQLPEELGLVVAGGLTPANVAAAVTRLAPDVVDVSSGVEARAGEKDPERVEAFIAAARDASPVSGPSS